MQSDIQYCTVLYPMQQYKLSYLDWAWRISSTWTPVNEILDDGCYQNLGLFVCVVWSLLCEGPFNVRNKLLDLSLVNGNVPLINIVCSLRRVKQCPSPRLKTTFIHYHFTSGWHEEQNLFSHPLTRVCLKAAFEQLSVFIHVLITFLIWTLEHQTYKQDDIWWFGTQQINQVILISTYHLRYQVTTTEVWPLFLTHILHESSSVFLQGKH